MEGDNKNLERISNRNDRGALLGLKEVNQGPIISVDVST